MDKTYTAVYYNSSGRFFTATVFISSITLSIRYYDEKNELKDVYWLAENISSLQDEQSSWVLLYINKDAQTERLVIRDMQLVEAIRKQFSHHRFVGGWRHLVYGNTRNKLLIFFAVLIAVVVAAYSLFIPWLGERIAVNISKGWEISMGEKMHQTLVQQNRIDSVKTNLINIFYKELRYTSSYPVKVTVVESKEMNAYAVPGGNIVVYTTLLDRLQNSEELAALLAHEASHIELRHSLKNIFRSMARKMFLMLIFGNEAGLAGYLVNNADNLKSLEYSRSLETEADNTGIRLMVAGNINVTGMLQLMTILQQETNAKEPAAFLSTHPVFTRRIENIKSKIKNADTPAKNEKLALIFKELQNAALD
jgi:predicted Zn-dependent protease